MKKQSTTTFPDWVREFGVRKLARALHLDASAVSKWANGCTRPSLEHAEAVLKLAKGRLKLADITKGGAQ